MTQQLLTKEFLDKYPDSPSHQNELSSFVFYRTYSRWLENKKRRETWKEAVTRAVNYNVSLSIKEISKYKGLYEKQYPNIVAEAETLFDNIFNLRQFLSGRTHWVGGADTGVAEKFPLANFNCSFINISRLDSVQNDLADLFYLLLVGTGVGFKCTKEMANNLPSIRNDINVIHKPYELLPKAQRIENTQFHIMDNGYAKIWVGDSKEGWVDALRHFFNIHTDSLFNHIHTITFSYNSIRKKGDRLKTFGGTASGYEPLKEMFEGFYKVIHNEIDPNLKPLEIDSNETNRVRLRPIHILDMGNLVGNNVVVGGVRRTAEIFLCDEDDFEVIFAKYGINGIWGIDGERHHLKVLKALKKLKIEIPEWMKTIKLNDENARPLHHRRMSNNSIAFEKKPSKTFLDLIFLIMQGEGEPGFVNLEAARKRRPNAEGLNPCAEILLDSYGVCNLTTVNVDAFVYLDDNGTYQLDISGLYQAQALSTRAGIRMTCVDLELPHWDAVQKRDRLIGASVTGWKDAMSKLGWDKDKEENLESMLANITSQTSISYSHILRIPTPLLDTTVKPEGTLSQVAGGVSSGLHVSHAPFYIRRIRINAHDPLVNVAKALNWTINPEVGNDPTNPRTLVIDFPVKSGSTKTKSDQTVRDQFDTYFSFQDRYTAHNSSNTISVKPSEWEEACKIVFDNWNDFVGVSFLADDGGNYDLAPYQEITEAEYWVLNEQMGKFDPTILELYEKEFYEELDYLEACETGACPIR